MIPAPMLCTPADFKDLGRFIVDDNWVLEQKIDGHRVRWNLTDGGFTNRAGNEYTKPVPQRLRNLLPIQGGYVLDGELLDGKFYAFDILQEPNLAQYKLTERRDLLIALVQSIWSLMCIQDGKVGYTEDELFALPLQVVPQAETREEKEALAKRVITENLEGVVAKRKDSIYNPGRGYGWMKIKMEVTADVIVMAVRDDGKESAKLGIMRGKRIVEVGRCSLIGKPPVKVYDVVEVKYLYMTTDGRLYQPTLHRVRFDKVPEECDGSDFRVVNKSVIKHL